jgi:hypothetical protein
VRPGLRAPLLTALLACTGCIDYIPLAPEPTWPEEANAPAYLSVNVTYDADVDSLRVYAILQPGTDVGGKARTLSDPTLSVGGVVIHPVRHGDEDALHYAARIPIASIGTDAVRVRPPAVAGTVSAPGDVVLRFPSRVGPAEVAIAPAADPVVHLLPGGTDPLPDQRSWTLLLTAGEHRAVLQRDGVEPDSIRIPRDLLPGPAGATVRATLMTSASRYPRRDDTDYSSSLSLSSSLSWTLVPAAP